MRVLVVEDEAVMAEGLRRALTREGHVVDVVGEGSEALWLAGSVEFDVVLLDVGLPDVDGLEVCRQLRATGSRVPVLVLTARGRTGERVAGLDAGADDYLGKPFELAELLARIRALGRRGVGSGAAALTAAGVMLDLAARAVTVDGVPVELQPKPLALLELLLRHPGEVVSRDHILGALWDFAADPGPNGVDLVVTRLRRAIDPPGGVSRIDTVRGAGYRMRRGL